MTRPDFERQLAQLRARIAELPADQRPALEALAAETAERHEFIVRHSLGATRAAERLELAFERLGEACRRVTALAEEARRLVARPVPPRPAPGMN